MTGSETLLWKPKILDQSLTVPEKKQEKKLWLGNLQVRDIDQIKRAKNMLAMSRLHETFRDKPIMYHRLYQNAEPIKFPKAIRKAYAKLWSGTVTRAIIKAPRGGGKSKLLGTIGFDFWFFKRRKVVNMGGSLTQARIVYGYFKDYVDQNDAVMSSVRGKATMQGTLGKYGNAFNCVTASPKQVRGKHPDVLLSDETCETDDALVHAALPMVDTSEHPLVVMASTFHKVFGIFQDVWDNADFYGYERISWDIFDIVKAFDPSFWDQPEVRTVPGIEKIKALSAGRTGDPEGWINIKNVIQAWKEKPSEDWFMIEYMGSRPSAAGLVLNPQDVDKAVFDYEEERRYNFVKGAECVMGVDWGFSSMTAVTNAMRYTDEVVILQGATTFTRAKLDTIIEYIVKKVAQKGIHIIYADSAGKFENDQLQNRLNASLDADGKRIECTVIEVVFSKEKEGMLGNLRAHFENEKIKISSKLKTAVWQLKRYRYQEGSDKPVKKDDHIPDSLMCLLQHFVIGVQNDIQDSYDPDNEEDTTYFSRELSDKY